MNICMYMHTYIIMHLCTDINLPGVLFVSFRATLRSEWESYCMTIGHWMTKFGNLAVSVRISYFAVQYLYDSYHTVDHVDAPFL